MPPAGDSAAERPQTFDEELLLWLGDEPPEVRAADTERIHHIAAELAMGFDALEHSVAHRFIVAETPQAAGDVLRALWRDGVSASVDLLGEATVSAQEADRYASASASENDSHTIRWKRAMALSLAGIRRPWGTICERSPGCWSSTASVSSDRVWFHISTHSSAFSGASAGSTYMSAMNWQLSGPVGWMVAGNATQSSCTSVVVGHMNV